ncbi:MAG TPA: hypothetical protein VFH43_12425 [Candidatus Kapabacteria bacterium]|jgi:hypothetical protein|nr:hypothetical protein [Candidatus Kapabacteria bacterium]
MRQLKTAIFLCAIALLLPSCKSDSTGPGDGKPNPEVVIPIQIQAGLGSTFTYEVIDYDASGAEVDRDGGTMTLLSKAASVGGHDNVHVFTTEGVPVWNYQVDAQDRMWEYRPPYSVNGEQRPGIWVKLPTNGTGTTLTTLLDDTSSEGQMTTRTLQTMQHTGVGRVNVEVDGEIFSGSKVNSVITTTGYINGEKFSESMIESEAIYLPKFAIMAYQRVERPFNSGSQELRLVAIDLK